MATIQTDGEPQNKGTYLTRENWEVMKPFVKFGVKALAVMGSVAWGIIKLAPRLLAYKPEDQKSDKVTKVQQ